MTGLYLVTYAAPYLHVLSDEQHPSLAVSVWPVGPVPARRTLAPDDSERNLNVWIWKVRLCCVNVQALFIKCNRTAFPHLPKLTSVSATRTDAWPAIDLDEIIRALSSSSVRLCPSPCSNINQDECFGRSRLYNLCIAKWIHCCSVFCWEWSSRKMKFKRYSDTRMEKKKEIADVLNIPLLFFTDLEKPGNSDHTE